MIPKEEIYIPPMNINVLDHRHFGRKPIVGVHVIKSLLKYQVNRELEPLMFSNMLNNSDGSVVLKMNNSDDSDDNTKAKKSTSLGSKMKVLLKSANKRRDSRFKRINKAFGTNTGSEMAVIEEDIDWWCKFYASLGEIKKCGSYLKKKYEKITVNVKLNLK
jgi:myoferlin